MEISKTEIGNALTSADENHILATANDIYDETQQAYQSEINKSLAEDKQDKLVSGSNIKTVNGKSLLGDGDITIEGGDSIGDVDEGRLVWSEEAVSQGTIIDNIMYNTHQNGLAFMNPSCIDVYYSTDNGDTWQDYGLTTTQKMYLVTPVTGNYSLFLGKDSTNKSVNYRLRVDLRIKDADIQFTGKKLYLRWLSNASSDAYYIDISVLKYENYESNEWTHVGTFHKKNTLTIPLNGVMGYKGAGGVLSLRIEVYRTGTTEPRYNSALTNIAFLHTSYTKGNSFGRTGLPMTIDTSQNATFPFFIRATKLITKNGTANQVVLGNGSLRPISELSPITDADADILLDNHIHGIDIKASGDDVNINIIESTKNGNAWETTKKSLPIPVATQETAGVISAADKQKIDAFDYEDNTLFVGDGTNGTLSIGYESSKASAEMRVQRDRYATIHATSYNNTSGGSIVEMESHGGNGIIEVNGDQFAKLVLSGAGQVRATLTKENEDGTDVKTVIDAEEGITAPKLATIGGTSEQILLGDGTLITFDELKAKLGLI